MIFFFFPFPKRLKAEKLGHRPQNSSDQETVSVASLNKRNLHKIWLLCSKLSSKAIPKGFLPSHIPPCIHAMSQPAYTFCAIVCHESALLFWTHIWDNISGSDRDQNERPSGAWTCFTRVFLFVDIWATHIALLPGEYPCVRTGAVCCHISHFLCPCLQGRVARAAVKR